MWLNGRPVDLVISDMAPNTSGIKAVDQPRGMYLAELALDFAQTMLAARRRFSGQGFSGRRF
jgi:23S rRNA (uridine2552-2'-O)-methyltransferase